MDVDKTIYSYCSKKQIPHVTAKDAESRFVGSKRQLYCNNPHNRLTADFQSSVSLFKEVLPFSLKK